MTFKFLTTVCASIFTCLMITLWVAPQIIYGLFGVEGAPIGDFVAKRAACLFLGLATLCILVRGSKLAELQRVIAISIGLAMLAMAATGTYEVLRGFAGAGIWPAIIAELMIAVGYLWTQTTGNTTSI